MKDQIIFSISNWSPWERKKLPLVDIDEVLKKCGDTCIHTHNKSINNKIKSMFYFLLFLGGGGPFESVSV